MLRKVIFSCLDIVENGDEKQILRKDEGKC